VRRHGNRDGRLLALAPLAIEARAVRAGAPDAAVVRTGIGARRARAAAARAAALPGAAVAVTGVAGGLDGLGPGELVVATQLRTQDGVIDCPGAELLAGELRRHGLDAHAGPVVSSERLVFGARRRALAAEGALAADMESAWLAEAAAGRPLAVVRAIADVPRLPGSTVRGGLRALRALKAAAPVLEEWARAVGEREVLLAGTRASCAGVDRAVEVVERALDRYGAPVYVRRQIVHNAHVVAELEARGAIFVRELDEVPDGALVVFSAHGVAPAVRLEARARSLEVIDATCPLVEKVHREARRFAAEGRTVVLVGHEGHDEIEGTLGEAPESIRLVRDRAEAEALEVADPERVAYLTQTTLAVDETRQTVDALRARFPTIAGPATEDICFATQNRQDAVKELAERCDLVLVVGSRNSSNANRLVEVAQRHGARAVLIEDETAIAPETLAGVRRVGLTAGASTPERVVQRVLAALPVLGPVTVSERPGPRETVRFKLPPEVTKED
jgi:4-hydroxy-3-methylbut-2-enyl diphosphate reductase